jgi:hypothetical protein
MSGLCLIGFAGITGANGDPIRAVKLLGAMDVARTAYGGWPDTPDQIAYERVLAQVYAQLDDTALAAVRAEGRAMTMEQAIDLALA